MPPLSPHKLEALAVQLNMPVEVVASVFQTEWDSWGVGPEGGVPTMDPRCMCVWVWVWVCVCVRVRARARTCTCLDTL